MRKALTAMLVGVALSGAGAAWWLSPPRVSPRELPVGQIAAQAPEGLQLLGSADAVTDHEPLMAAFEAQQKRTWCGVASSTIVLNALRPDAPTSQRAYFDRAPRSWWWTTLSGMSLSDLADGLRAHGLSVEVHPASATTLEAFRALAAENLRTPGDYVIVNYDRQAVQQEGGGHISPLAAYHADQDRLLLLDVASHKYPPMWIGASELFAAMDTTDPASGLSRGFVVVR